MLYPYKGTMPQVAEGVFVAPGARVVGRVTIERDASVWFNCVLRGDSDTVIMGRPAKVVRQVEERDLAMIRRGAENYRQNARDYVAAALPTV